MAKPGGNDYGEGNPHIVRSAGALKQTAAPWEGAIVDQKAPCTLG